MNYSAMAALAALILVTSCNTPPAMREPTVYETQSAPGNYRPLAPDSSQTGPRGNALPPAGAAGAEASERVAVKKTVKVALLLPLTGRNAELGKALQDAASIALFDKYAQLSARMQATKVELLPKDTGDSPEIARKAMQEAAAEGAALVIGPVFSDATEVVAPIAAAKHIPILSFSNNRAKASSGVYMLGFSPQEQTFRVVNYALQRDRKRIAVLAPKSALGDEVIAAARTAAANAGVNLVAEVQYPPQAVGLESAFAKLVPSGGTPAFDTLLIAEGGPALDTILRALSARGVSAANTQFLGTGLWDDAALRRRVNLDGAWFASSPPEMTAQFENRFRTTYNYTSPRIASLAYDAVALAVALATSGREFNAEAMTNPAGFLGPANGIFRLKTGGITERGLAVIEISGTGLRVISQAPSGFPAN